MHLKIVYECVEKKNQLDATEWFVALIICSTCFGQVYAHHQELETICVLLPPMVCSALLLVVGGQVQAASYASRRGMLHDVQHPSSGRIACCLHLTPDNEQQSTAHHRR